MTAAVAGTIVWPLLQVAANAQTAPAPNAAPGGTFTVTGGPPSVGTFTSPPSTASGKVTGTLTVR